MSLNKIVGYYKSWDPTSPTPENIDRAYNYIIYAFLSVDNHGNLDFHGDEGVNISMSSNQTKNQDISKHSNFADTIRRLRSFNSGRKLLLSVGGWNVGSVKFSNIAADRRKVETMADSALSLMQQYGFDGLDIDWEYPAQNGGSPADRVPTNEN
jgi:GH18 family chitinase